MMHAFFLFTSILSLDEFSMLNEESYILNFSLIYITEKNNNKMMHCINIICIWFIRQNLTTFWFFRLVGEVNEIAQSIDALTEQLNNAENSRKDLQDNRMALEKEIACKKNSIFIDRDKCVSVRTRYPTTLKLQGYQ